ncbi:MAG TPA: oxidoreductase-like domain-containing protein [Pseudomonadota bacterium]|nr:hypothetical protein [Xanthomonadales bacterium]HQW64875.1 oxidoreductase-like domain-containing protein [Pseudomonadota bacterium]MBP6691373.1 hypothetical protein [Xanthomonadales bacterium]MBP7417850.1 hypothetical protein [Xanthomonadales bacterium]MBP8177164.1 hypothetical protein [Xanthomonadales bacterium]
MRHEPPPALPPRPEPPQPGDCCGGGCARCVIDAYEEQLAEWQALVDALHATAPGQGRGPP